MASVVSLGKVNRFVSDLLCPVMHKKRAVAIGFAVYGTMRANRLSSTVIGRALAAYRGTSPKNGIKQVDRLLGNEKFDVQKVFECYVPWLVGHRKEIVVSLDWTEYAKDGHSRIAINLITKHGRATPLVWQTVETTTLKNHRNTYEDEALALLAKVLPCGVNVIVLADRGFGDTKLYRYLAKTLKWDFVIRFRGCIAVHAEGGEARRASTWVPPNGRARELQNARVTRCKVLLPAVVFVKKSGMKEAWYLATTLAGQKDRVVQLYGRRFTCEENFRDEKDDRFGLGFKETGVSTVHRRNRLLVINALATVILTLLGAAGEALGYDRRLKANTVRKRTHSLFRQGREYLHGVMLDLAGLLECVFLELLFGHQPVETCDLI